jgi:hypothetical protein
MAKNRCREVTELHTATVISDSTNECTSVGPSNHLKSGKGVLSTAELPAKMRMCWFYHVCSSDRAADWTESSISIRTDHGYLHIPPYAISRTSLAVHQTYG